MTKEQYQEAIENQVQRRRNAITAIAEMTKGVYNANGLIDQADIAADAYHMTRLLRAEMKTVFPTQCTCVCDDHKQEA